MLYDEKKPAGRWSSRPLAVVLIGCAVGVTRPWPPAEPMVTRAPASQPAAARSAPRSCGGPAPAAREAPRAGRRVRRLPRAATTPASPGTPTSSSAWTATRTWRRTRRSRVEKRVANVFFTPDEKPKWQKAIRDYEPGRRSSRTPARHGRRGVHGLPRRTWRVAALRRASSTTWTGACPATRSAARRNSCADVPRADPAGRRPGRPPGGLGDPSRAGRPQHPGARRGAELPLLPHRQASPLLQRAATSQASCRTLRTGNCGLGATGPRRRPRRLSARRSPGEAALHVLPPGPVASATTAT